METWQNIETVVLERIAQARQQLDTAAQEQRHFGILIPHKIEAQHTTSTPRAAKAQQTLGSLTTREQERQQFITSLKERGLVPLGVLPATVFNRLCQHWCYRFEHFDIQGGCGIKSVHDIGKFLFPIGMGGSLKESFGPLATFTVVVTLIQAMCMVPIGNAPPRIFLIVFTSLFELWLWCSCLPKLRAWVLSYLTPKRLLLHLIFPHKVDLDTKEKITINFSEVTESFREQLVNLERAGVKPMIAAVPGAIHFKRRAVYTVSRGVIEEEIGEGDPILYHTHGNWTAIFAQSGKFASEKRIMRAAQKYVPLAI